jgi:chaperonin GroES
MITENTAPAEEVPSQGTDPEQGQGFRAILESNNIVEHLDDDKLTEIGMLCKRGFEADVDSRKEWMDEIEDWLKLAKQIREKKNFPWRNSSNIKFPLMATAAMQFSARAYPALVPSDGGIVKARVIGQDPSGKKTEKANRVSEFMSWQVMYDMENWEEDFDRMLMQLSIIGNMYKKTYWDKSKGKSLSKVIPVDNLVVNYWTRSLEEAERISEIIYMYPRVLKNRQRAKVFREIDLGTPITPEGWNASSEDKEVIPYSLIEQHTYLDLNDDGYKEPYVVTFHRESGKVLRIAARFDQDNVYANKDGVVDIEPIHYYTKYGFIPNPDGSFYDLGFGHLLGPINESVNTLVNQLIDAGTINNLQSGFIGKGLKVRGGNYEFEPGEWKWVNATGDDLRKQIVPLPTKEPSKVLLELFQFLVTAGKELASVAEIFVGKMPGQNTPATTTMASIEQGMKVFTAIYKRIYRSLEKEFKKLFALNKTYLEDQEYVTVLDTQGDISDFDGTGYDICPAADPSGTSQSEKEAKAQVLLDLLPTGVIDPMKSVMRVLEAKQIPNWQELIPGLVETGQPAPPPPNPKMQEMQAKAETDKMLAEVKAQAIEHKAQMDQRTKEFELMMKAQEGRQKLQHEAAMNQLRAQSEAHMQNIYMRGEQMKAATQAQGHQQQMEQQAQTHQQTMRHTEEAQKLKQQSQSMNGGNGKNTSSQRSRSKPSKTAKK